MLPDCASRAELGHILSFSVPSWASIKEVAHRSDWYRLCGRVLIGCDKGLMAYGDHHIFPKDTGLNHLHVSYKATNRYTCTCAECIASQYIAAIIGFVLDKFYTSDGLTLLSYI